MAVNIKLRISVPVTKENKSVFEKKIAELAYISKSYFENAEVTIDIPSSYDPESIESVEDQINETIYF